MTNGSTSFRSFMNGTVALKRWRLSLILFLAYFGVTSVGDLSRASSSHDTLMAVLTNLPWPLAIAFLVSWIDWAAECHRGDQIALCVITFIVLCVISAAVSKNSKTRIPANDQRRTTNDHP